MPPHYLSEYEDFYMTNSNLSPINVKFPEEGLKPIYRVIPYTSKGNKWDWKHPFSYDDPELALAEADRQFSYFMASRSKKLPSSHK